MNKKLNTFIFVVIATIFNVVLIISLMLISSLAVGLIIPKDIPKGLMKIISTAVLLGTLILAFYLYQVIISAIDKKFDLDKYLYPIFRSKKKNNPDNKMMY